MNKAIIFINILIIFLVVSAACFALIVSKKISPKIIIWAWEQPQDLRFIKDNNIGIACYAGMITLQDGNIVFAPRHQPLIFNQETSITPVIRIESKGTNSTIYDDKISEISELIVKQCLSGKASGCQIDYDAKISEIPFYRKLISETKKALPKSIPLSITALVSWCDQDSWLENADIDEAIPMFFSMGPDSHDILNGFVGKSFLQEKKCQTSIGISADEPLPPARYMTGKKVYIFHSASWNQKDLFDIINKI